MAGAAGSAGPAGSDPLLGFPAVWLRHNCPCPDCRDPVTGQRLVDVTELPDAGDGADPRTEDGKVLWATGPGGLPDGVPAAGWATYRADDAVRLSLLDAVAPR